jgi:hypothetical protein
MTEQARHLFIIAAHHHYPAQTLLGGVIFIGVIVGMLGVMGFAVTRRRQER